MAMSPRALALSEAVRIAPGDLELRAMLARVLLDEAPEAAVIEYREILRQTPGDASALLGLARAYRACGKGPAALVAVEDLLIRAGGSADALKLKASLLLDDGHPMAAADAYRRAIELDPGVGDVAFASRLGIALGPSGETMPGSDSVPNPTDERDRADPDRPSEADNDRARVRIGPEEDLPSGEPLEMERPRITFADVGGMEPIKEDIRLKILAPVQNAELYAAYGKSAGGGILLYGPPGCGKTYLARATAGEMGRGFLSVGISDILDMWLGQSERNLRDVFDGARAHQPCVLFFDEVDALAANRTDLRHSAGRNVVNQFLSELDGIESSNEGVLVLAATNAPWHLDSAFRRPGRFDRVIFVPPPDPPARAAILSLLLRGKPVADIDIAKVAERLDMFSGADLKGLVDVAVERKLAAAMRTGIPTPLGTKDLLDAAKAVTPTTKEWFATVRNHVLYANQSGLYDDVRAWLRL